MCICCGGGHTLDACVQLGRRSHEKKIGFLKENGICFSCLCTGYISKDCRKRISCSKCSLKHPTILHREPADDSEENKRNTEGHVDNKLVSSGLTGAGDQDCKLPIVPVQVKSNKGSKIVNTYAFLDQGSTAVFCTESLMHKLHLTGRRGHILLRTSCERESCEQPHSIRTRVCSTGGGTIFWSCQRLTHKSPCLCIEEIF